VIAELFDEEREAIGERSPPPSGGVAIGAGRAGHVAATTEADWHAVGNQRAC